MLILWSVIKEVFLPGAAGAVAAIAALKYLSSKFVEQQLSKDLEKHKTELSQRTESLKTQLSIYAHEQNVATSRVDGQKAEAIKNVYSAIRGWINPTTIIISGCPLVNASEENEFQFYSKTAEEAHAAAKKLADVLADHAIYFDEETYRELYEMSIICLEATAYFLRPIRRDIAEGRQVSGSLNAIQIEKNKLSGTWENKLLPINSRMTIKFRAILNISKA
ncbi:hypothetical protein [Geobacter sp. SVR]|uniref:hypothetical protein n=1 Tax=Geobacter sp. SVR TaxID=2495594 RepID=UPI00143EFA4F|nr:hypothetical protein [Geobacter sp. SVR]BCS53455.1 hypothetical protein GSVR_17630 [Geobacter sp. SVR]GCF85418.1 hypothetical protein GSbR_20180 [Geobacter sp. SVR]